MLARVSCPSILHASTQIPAKLLLFCKRLICNDDATSQAGKLQSQEACNKANASSQIWTDGKETTECKHQYTASKVNGQHENMTCHFRHDSSCDHAQAAEALLFALPCTYIHQMGTIYSNRYRTRLTCRKVLGWKFKVV